MDNLSTGVEIKEKRKTVVRDPELVALMLKAKPKAPKTIEMDTKGQTKLAAPVRDPELVALMMKHKPAALSAESKKSGERKRWQLVRDPDVAALMVAAKKSATNSTDQGAGPKTNFNMGHYLPGKPKVTKKSPRKKLFQSTKAHGKKSKIKKPKESISPQPLDLTDLNNDITYQPSFKVENLNSDVSTPISDFEMAEDQFRSAKKLKQTTNSSTVTNSHNINLILNLVTEQQKELENFEAQFNSFKSDYLERNNKIVNLLHTTIEGTKENYPKDGCTPARIGIPGSAAFNNCKRAFPFLPTPRVNKTEGNSGSIRKKLSKKVLQQFLMLEEKS